MSMKTKIQVEALQALANLRAVSYSEDNEFTYLTVDGCRLIKIPNSRFFLDKTKLHKDECLTDYFRADFSCMYRLKDTTRRKMLKKGVALCLEFARLNDIKDTLYCEWELLKPLLDNSTKMFTDDSKKTIYLVKNDDVYAVVRKFCFL